MLDTQYSLRAQEIGTKRITKASELRTAMERYVPSDVEFEEAFSVCPRLTTIVREIPTTRAGKKAGKGYIPT